MARRLPPLNALRAFEAAARQLSFTKAAEELNVTQAAISHQVKLLEETLGVALFRRLNRRLVLTDAGAAYLPPLREALDGIASATERLHQSAETGPLKVSTLHSFAVKWLLPRLPHFLERHPEIDVLVSSSAGLVDFATDDFDVALRYGSGKYPGLQVDVLMGDEIIPVCSPGLRDRDPPLRTPSDLKRVTLLHDVVRSTPDDPDWKIWLDHAGVEGVDPSRGPRFSEANMVIQAAIAGQGVALTRRVIVKDDLDAGMLVQPFGPALATNFVYCLVYPPISAERPKLKLFRDWLMEEAAEARADQTGPGQSEVGQAGAGQAGTALPSSALP